LSKNLNKRKGRLWQKGWPDHAGLRVSVPTVVPFQDADPTGFAWHGNYFRYYDLARVALLKQLEFGYRQMAQVGQIWPIVETQARYLKSIPFGSTIHISAQLVEWEFRLRIYYDITNPERLRLNEAYTVQVPVNAADESLVIGVPADVQTRVHALIDRGTQ
jgi:acyl-CoA thioester hydrolase